MQPSSHSWRSNSTITSPADPPDSLINSAEAKRLAGGISAMTLWRWEKEKIIPPPIKIRGRNYWSKSGYMRALVNAANSDNSEQPPV